MVRDLKQMEEYINVIAFPTEMQFVIIFHCNRVCPQEFSSLFDNIIFNGLVILVCNYDSNSGFYYFIPKVDRE